MPAKPEFVTQTAEKMPADKRREWCKSAARGAERQGARWHRYRYDEPTGTLLYEGWKVRPDKEGDPRFQFINGPGGGSI